MVLLAEPLPATTTLWRTSSFPLMVNSLFLLLGVRVGFRFLSLSLSLSLSNDEYLLHACQLICFSLFFQKRGLVLNPPSKRVEKLFLIKKQLLLFNPLQPDEKILLSLSLSTPNGETNARQIHSSLGHCYRKDHSSICWPHQ
jgi:hypothetical protein